MYLNTGISHLFRKYKAYLILFAFFVVLPFPIKAQEIAGVQIKPALFEDRVDPGDIYEATLRVTNLSDMDQVYYLNKRDISYMTDTGQPIYAEDGEKTGFEMSSWITLDSSVIVQPAQTIEVPMVVTVPEDATPGGHFAGIFITTQPVKPDTTGSGVGYQVATIVNLRISGAVTEEAEIREFRTDKGVYSQADVRFITRVENRGNVLVRPRGPLEITNMFGKKVGLIRMNDSGGGIFPGSERQFEVVWEDEGFHIGRYTALMGLIYGEETRQNISASTSFLILPMKVILSVLGGLIGLILIVYVFLKLYIRTKVNQVQGIAGRRMTGAVGRHSPMYRRQSAAPKLVFLTIGMLLLILVLMMGFFFIFA